MFIHMACGTCVLIRLYEEGVRLGLGSWGQGFSVEIDAYLTSAPLYVNPYISNETKKDFRKIKIVKEMA